MGSVAQDSLGAVLGGVPLSGSFHTSVARTTLDDREACLKDAKRLQPGMPAEVHIQTGERNVLSYVMKPLSDQMGRAFRE